MTKKETCEELGRLRDMFEDSPEYQEARRELDHMKSLPPSKLLKYLETHQPANAGHVGSDRRSE